MRHINTKSAPLSKRIPLQFAAYRNAISRIAFVTTFLVISFLAALPEVSRAQCPDSTGPAPNPDSVAWVQDTTEQMIPGTDCSIYIYFCYREIPSSPDTIQTYLDGVAIDSTTDCDSLADSTLIDQGRNLLGPAVAIIFQSQLEPCIKGGYIIEEVFSPTCWSPSSTSGLGGAHGVYIAPCAAFNFYCEKECQVCWDPLTSQPVLQNCIVTGPDVSVPCLSATQWLPGGCYYASCFAATYGIETSLGVTPTPKVDTSMQAYPNPTLGSLTITSIISGEPVQILDVLGRVVMNGVISTNGSLILDVSSLSAGTYYVSAGHSEVKFIKN